MLKIDPNSQAFPTPPVYAEFVRETQAWAPEPGLTIRAELAARAMQGLLSYNGADDYRSPEAFLECAIPMCVRYADALIAALNREAQ